MLERENQRATPCDLVDRSHVAVSRPTISLRGDALAGVAAFLEERRRMRAFRK